jgi:hypothetical protein
VIAGQPPAPDVEVHGRERLWAVQVVEEPEQPFLLLAGPIDREVGVAQELLQDLAVFTHELVLSS